MTIPSDETYENQEFSFADELERLLPELLAFARSLCRNADLAEDLVQDCCLKAWHNIDSFRPGAPLRPWLFRILRNEFYQISRRSWRSTSLEPAVAEQRLVSDAGLDAGLDFQVLQEALSRLQEIQREAIILVLAAGYTYEEAGEICGCASGTIKSRVNRGREFLIDYMRRADEGASSFEGGPETRNSSCHLRLVEDIEILARNLLKAA